MNLNLIKKKIIVKIIKLILYPIEQIRYFFLKDYSKVFFISDNASWATDKTTKSINKFFEINNVDTKNIYHETYKQYLYYTDQYAVLKSNLIKNKNIIAIDYQHGITKYLKNNLNLLKKIKKFQNKIKIIRVTNSFFKNYLIKNGIKRHKIMIVPLTVDTNLFYPKKNKIILKNKYNLPLNKFLIGSFHKDGNGWDYGLSRKLIKGPDIFVKSIIKLKKKIGKKKFAIVLTAPARGYVKEKLYQNDIEFYHFQNVKQNNLADLYNCLDLYLIASRDEGGPMGLFEAMACGTPVVTTNVGHAVDHIVNYKNGFRSKIEDYNSLTNHIIRVIKNKNLKNKIIKNSIITARKNNYSNHKKYWKIFIKKFIENKTN